MRDIKFRAWSLKNKKMFYDIQEFEHAEHYLVNNYDLVVMQYTGLKDKNGKEIYEGDILEEIYIGKNPKTDYSEYAKLQVTFLDGSFVCEPILNEKLIKDFNGFEIYCIDDISSKKIIGNIHENPELLTN